MTSSTFVSNSHGHHQSLIEKYQINLARFIHDMQDSIHPARKAKALVNAVFLFMITLISLTVALVSVFQ